MPTYDYKCNKCGNVFEVFQKITDEPLQKCPDCSGNIKRLISGGAGIIFKGSGFYVNDYKKKNEKPTGTSKPFTKTVGTSNSKETVSTPKDNK